MLPETIENVEHLEMLLSEPTAGGILAMNALSGEVIVLGAGGKMGPTLSRMIKRSSGEKRRIIAVSRFSDLRAESQLQVDGIETIRCDLLDETQLNALPDAPNVIYMAGMKFGTTGQEALTWAMNTYLPALVCRKYHASRIIAFSTGNVYPLTPVSLGGSVERDPPEPVGEYGISCLGRERIFEYFSRMLGTQVAILRLNYAVELRYGVLVDLAQKVWQGETIDVTMGNVNVIWQGDASAMAIQALTKTASPPFIMNIAGPETLSVRRVCEQFAQMMGVEVHFTGTESPYVLLSNGQLGHDLFGYPRISVRQMMRWIADWIMRGGETLHKPTHFETRDGRF